MPVDPRFTILCATYNQADYLAEMLESAFRQTLDDFEVIVVDDGSTDHTRQVLDDVLASHAGMRSKVVVEHTQNGGQTAAFERGFQLARGEYVCLLDSDDRFHPTKLWEIDRVARSRPEAGMIMHPLAVIDPEGRSTGVVRPLAASLSDGDIRLQMRRRGRHVAPGASGLVFRRDVMARLFPAPTTAFSFAADAYLSFGAACLAPVAAVDAVLADYRMQPQGQYFRRMMSAEGLRRQVAFQDVVARHFGVLEASRHNSHFARNRFASAMLDGPWSHRLTEYRRLQGAVLGDPHFSLTQRALLAAFWSMALVAGPRAFPALWGWFQRRQTGWDKVLGAHAVRTSAEHVSASVPVSASRRRPEVSGDPR